MKILIVAATFAEIAPFMQDRGFSDQNFTQSSRFDVLITGVGMTATAFALGQYLNRSYHLVLNVGIAGAFNQSLALGDLVNVTQDCFAELGAEDRDDFFTIDKLGFGKSVYPATGLHPLEVFQARAITVNKVHGAIESISKIKERLNPDIESMEGAAVFFACDQLKLPCLQIRSISNYVEPRDREKWAIGLAIRNLNDWLAAFIQDDLTDKIEKSNP